MKHERQFDTVFQQLSVYTKQYFKFDLVAAIVVFLVAIPLCLGIALASGAPLFSGILSGVVGGIVVGAFSGSPVSVSGPAAGMATVVLGALAQLGDFQVFLLALCLAGVLQMVVGMIRAGFIVEYVPSHVVQGLLCAIGILLIVKQLPLAFTLSSTLQELQAHLLETTEGFSFSPLNQFYHHINGGAALISLLSFGILIFFEKTKRPFIKSIPAPIMVVIFGILINELFLNVFPSLAQNGAHLVNIPPNESWSDFWSKFQSPNWSAWQNPHVYLYAFMMAIVASLESLLNVKAGERLDKTHLTCSKNRELVAQGLGNLTAGLVGGIPITSVIVRTSVNIEAGAKSKVSTILHGVFLFAAVLAIPTILNKIPLAALAVILIMTGYKLNKPSIYKNIYSQGMDRFIPFIATVISIVMFNLLEGILIGLAISFFYILKTNSQARLDIIKEVYPTGTINRLILPQQVTFLNKASMVEELQAMPKGSQLIIDARYADYIDKEIIELIKEFKEETAPLNNISLNLMGFKDNYAVHNYIDFINATTYDVQATLTPKEVLTLLREGNHRFLRDKRIHRSSQMDIAFTAQAQHPIAVVLGCIDSRVPVETIFDMSFGDLFCVRIAGNVVNDDILASIEYATHFVGAKLIVVLGHTRCGAIQAACDGLQHGHVSQLLNKIKPSVETAERVFSPDHQQPGFVDEVTSLNIANTVSHIYSESEIIRTLINNNSVGIVGALYDVPHGIVTFQDLSLQISQLSECDGISKETTERLVAHMRPLMKGA